MPYISSTDKEYLQRHPPANAGQLNYNITMLIRDYLTVQAGDGPFNYEMLNSVVGALESCKLEFYRRMVVPYENSKIEQNGDVY